VARAAHNPLCEVLLDAIGAPLPVAGEWPATNLQAHEWILERIAARDAEGAREAMRVHLLDPRPLWEPLLPPEPLLEPGE
jgi:DNA-binding FadR family transcriptional regulator